MVQTRRRAAADSSNAPDTVPESRRSRAKTAEKPHRTVASSATPTRKRRRTSNDGQEDARATKRHVTGRRGRPRVQNRATTHDDKEAKEAPSNDSAFYDNIIRGVNRPPKPKSPAGATPGDQLPREVRANQDAEHKAHNARTSSAKVRNPKATQSRKSTFYERAKGTILVSAHPGELGDDETQDQYGPESDFEAAAAEAEGSLFVMEIGGIGEEEDDDEPEEEEDDFDSENAAEAEDENICKVDHLASYIRFIDPEPAGKKAVAATVYFKGVNSMIREIGQRGWIFETGDWTSEVLPVDHQKEGEWTAEHSEKLKGEHEMDLFKSALAVAHFCQKVPHGLDTEAQSGYLRRPESRKAIQTILSALDQSMRNFGNCLQKLNLEVAAKHRSTNNKQYAALQALYKRIIPMLVIALKRACRLGGSGVETDKHLEILEQEQGVFTVATLQIGLRIVHSIVELLKPIEEHLYLTGPPPNVPKGRLVAYNRRLRFGTLARGVQDGLLKGMRQLKYLAEAPRRRREAQAMYEARQMEIQRIEEANDRQMALFVQSTMSQGYEKQRARDQYFARHGWHLWEDEKLLGVMRVVSSPDMSILARRVPPRSIGEVIARVADLRDMMRTKYELDGKVPPKWCYSW